MDTLKFVEWALKNGATGVLALVVVGLVYALRHKDREVTEAHKRISALEEARVTDVKMSVDIIGRYQEKNYKLAGDLSRVVDYLERQKRRSINDR